MVTDCTCRWCAAAVRATADLRRIEARRTAVRERLVRCGVLGLSDADEQRLDELDGRVAVARDVALDACADRDDHHAFERVQGRLW